MCRGDLLQASLIHNLLGGSSDCLDTGTSVLSLPGSESRPQKAQGGPLWKALFIIYRQHHQMAEQKQLQQVEAQHC